MSYNLVLNSKNVVGVNNNSYQFNFLHGSFTVPEGSEMGISQITLPYSFINVSSALGNNTFQYYIPTGSGGTQTAYSVVLANGFYTVSDIQNQLWATMKTNGHYYYNTQGVYSQQTQFVGTITGGNTLQISQTVSQAVQLSIGYVITYIPVGSTTVASTIITGYNATAGTYSITSSSTNTTIVAMTAQNNNEINPTIIYPLSLSTNVPLYTNQITSYTIPVLNNVISVFGAGFFPANGQNGQPSWAGGYPSGAYTGNACPYVVIPTTSSSTTTIGNILGFIGGSYPATNTGLASTILSSITAGNTLTTSPPFPPLGSNINGIVVRCNLVENNVQYPNDVLDSFPITATYGSNINYLPISDNWVKMKAGKFSNLTITFNDQNFNPLICLDNNVLITLLIKFPEKK